ncbi:MAG: redoxin domain-containing protein [bacterium]
MIYGIVMIKMINRILFFVIIGLLYINLAQAGVRVRDKARDFCLKSTSGEVVTLRSLQGDWIQDTKEKNIVVFSFFNVDSKACWQEIGTLQLLYRRYRDEGIILRLISIDTDNAKLNEFIKKYKIEIPVLLDPYGDKAGKLYGAVKGNKPADNIPRLIVVDKNNRVRLAVTKADDALLKRLQGKLEMWLAEDTCPMDDNNSLTIVYTGNADGYLESCNCPTRPFGGLSRRATCIKGLRKEKKNMLVVDTGDIFPCSPQKEQVISCLKAMELIGYDAITPGDQEFVLGYDFIRQEIEKKRLPFITSNLSLCIKNSCLPIANPYMIKELNGYRIAVIGVISEEAFAHKIQGLDVHDAVEQLNVLVDRLKKENKPDLIVLLSHMNYDSSSEIAKRVKGIDVIVVGHSMTLLKTPLMVNETILLQPGEKGQYVGIFCIDMKTKRIKNHLVPLTVDIPDDKQVREIINQYTKGLKEKTGSLSF